MFETSELYYVSHAELFSSNWSNTGYAKLSLDLQMCVYCIELFNYSRIWAILSLEPAAVIVLPNMFIYFIHTQHAIIMSLLLMYASSLTHFRGRVASAMCSKIVHDMSPGWHWTSSKIYIWQRNSLLLPHIERVHYC